MITARLSKAIDILLLIWLILISTNAEAKLADTPKGKIEIPPDFIEIKHIESRLPPPLTSEDQKRGYIIFIRDDLEGVYPNSIPEKNEIGNTIRTFATPGEYEPVSFSIYGITDLTGVTITADDLINSSKSSGISRKNISVNSVYCLAKKIGGDEEKKFGIIPELLIDGPVDVKKDTCKQFWMTIKVPENTPADTYEGTLSIIPTNGITSKVKIELEILPFTLLKPPDMYWGVFSSFKIDSRQLEDLSEHGIDSICGGHIWAHAPPRSLLDSRIPNHPTLANGVLDADSLRVGTQNSFRAFKQAGMRGQYVVALGWVSVGMANTFGIPALDNDPMFPKSYSPEVKQVYKNFIGVIKEEALKANVDTYFWAVDEPGTHPHLQKIALIEYPLLKECNAKTFLTSDIDFTRIMSPWVNARCYHATFLFRDQKTYDMLKNETEKAGAELWTYTGLGGTSSFYVARYRTGLLNWKAKIKTLMIFAYNNNRGDPYNDFDSSERDYMLVYPSLDGIHPVPTLQWEGVRQGIADAMYFYTLTDYIRSCNLSQDMALIKEAKIAEEELNGIMDNIAFIDDYVDFQKYNFDYRNFLQYRWKVAQQILKLKRLLEEKHTGSLNQMKRIEE